MDGTKVIQQLLRPTDTCVFVVQGYLLGLQPSAHRLFAVVKHEGSEEQALFLFEVNTMESPPQLTLERFFAIRGSFHAQIQMIHSAQCQVLVDNGEGSSLMLQLPYDTHTAVFLSQLSKALHNFTLSTSANLPTAFDWLQGYEHCRSGWDRFSKPGHSNSEDNSSSSLINFGREQVQPLRMAFPEAWPWSHIITPNSDGTTEVAPCEAMLMDFDPLYKMNHDAPETTSEDSEQQCKLVNFSVTRPTPENSPRLPATNNPFQVVDFHSGNPFASSSSSTTNDLDIERPPDIRHCISDSNLLTLKSEHHHTFNQLEPLVTRSEEDLTSVDGQGERHCVASSGYESGQCQLLQREELEHSRERDSSEERIDGSDLDSHPQQLNTQSLSITNSRPQTLAEVHRASSDEDLLDYKNRRVRSFDNSPTASSGGTRRLPREHFQQRLGFHSPSGTKALVSKVNMTSPVLSRRRARSRDRSSSKPLQPQSAWVSRYRPGVPVPSQSARESIVQAELRQREKEFCSSEEIRVFCGTWNVNGRFPPSTIEQFLLEYKLDDEKETLAPDIFAIAFQELDLSTQCLMGQDSSREEPWTDTVELTLRREGNYQKLCSVRMVGVFLLVYIKQNLFQFVSDVETEMVQTGMLGLMGNKGAVAVHFNLYHSSLCIVNAHLPAQMEEVEKRNQDYHTIMSKMVFSKFTDFVYNILDHDMMFWLGDLNYRIQTSPEMTAEQVKAYADAYQISALLRHDQLLQEAAKHNVFSGFTEGDINFKPTYKYDPNTDNWDSSEKHRAPAWCDRILYWGRGIQQRSYRSHHSLKISDHKPVSSLFDIAVRVVIPKKEREVLEQITWKLDKLENDTLPQVDLNAKEFTFKDVKFKAPQSKCLVVTNTGQRPVHVSFIPKLNDESYSKPWLSVKPSSAVIQPLEDVEMTVRVFVDEDSAPALTSSKDKLEDILVLHLEKGKDFFQISISGNYLPSCFGSSLEALIHMHTYIREVPVARLVDLTSSWELCSLGQPSESKDVPPPLDIPKELFQMVDHLNRHALEKENLFTDGGRKTELQAIQEMLDMGGRELPGSHYSIAAALLTFLSALAEPVVPTSLHSRCFECSGNATLCKQTLKQMPNVHKRTFVFLVTFMKDLLKCSEVNGLDHKVLATIFGDVLLRTPASERKSKSKRALNALNRKKAAFIYQFLVNDLTNPYH